MKTVISNSTFFYTNVSYNDAENYINKFFSKYGWLVGEACQGAEHLSIEFLASNNSEFISVQCDGYFNERFREDFIKYFSNFNSLPIKKMAYLDFQNSFLQEYEYGQPSYKVDESVEPEESIEAHFQTVSLSPNKEAIVVKHFLIYKRFQILSLPDVAALTRWGLIKTKSRKSIYVEGWRFMDRDDNYIKMLCEMDFEPDWKSMDRWLNSIVPKIEFSSKGLKRELLIIQEHFKTEPFIDILNSNGGIVWFFESPDMIRTDLLSGQKAILKKKSYYSIGIKIV